MNWTTAVWGTILVFNYTVGTALVWRAFQAYSDHSAMSIFRWVAIYSMAVIHPIVWSVYHLRVLRAKGIVIDRQIRAMVFSPLLVGGITLIIALNLIGLR